jgi:hypothetical protein
MCTKCQVTVLLATWLLQGWVRSMSWERTGGGLDEVHRTSATRRAVYLCLVPRENRDRMVRVFSVRQVSCLEEILWKNQ